MAKAPSNLKVNAAAKNQVSIQLSKIKRLHIYGQLFLADRVYTLDESDAERLLAVEYHDQPAFKRYKGKVALNQPQQDVVVSTGVKLPEVAPATEAAPANAINIGSEEELKELGLDTIDQDSEESAVSV